MHHGEVAPRYWPRARQILTRMENEARKAGFKPQEGHNSLEILCSAKWDKGQAALWLKRRGRCANVFYAGDDATDETVFRILRAQDVGVRIGRSRVSRAGFFLKTQSESERLLTTLIHL